jgi:hypothetical protein
MIINLVRIGFALILSLSLTAGGMGQESRCALKLADLPAAAELRGFNVRMTVDQVKSRLPKLQLRPADQFGFTSFNIFPDYETAIDKSAFAGVRTVSMEVLDGRVFSVWIGYDKTFKWQTIDEFVAGISTVLKLPNNWRSKFRTRLLDCADFSLAVIPVGESPSIKITDMAAKEQLDKRQALKEEAQP